MAPNQKKLHFLPVFAQLLFTSGAQSLVAVEQHRQEVSKIKLLH